MMISLESSTPNELEQAEASQLLMVATASATAAATDPAFAQFRDQTRFWIQRVAVPLLMVIGVFGNLITVVIMTRRRMRSTTNMYLAALALVDMFYLVLTFLLGLSHYPNMAQPPYQLYWHLRPFLMMLTDACSNTSVWLTVTFTIERYIAIRYPMKGKVWCTEARARMLIVCVFMFGILFAAPVPFEWKVIEKKVPSFVPETTTIAATIITGDTRNSNNNNHNHNHSYSHNGLPQIATANRQQQQTTTTSNPVKFNGDDDNETYANGFSYVLALDYSDFGRNDTYKTIYYRLTVVIFYFVPLFSLTLFNGYLIKSVHQSKRERTKLTVHGQQQTATASLRHQKQCVKPIPTKYEPPPPPPPSDTRGAAELATTTTDSMSLSTTMKTPTAAATIVVSSGEQANLISSELKRHSKEQAGLCEEAGLADGSSETGAQIVASSEYAECAQSSRNGAEKVDNGRRLACQCPNGKAKPTRDSDLICLPPEVAQIQTKPSGDPKTKTTTQLRLTFAKRAKQQQQPQISSPSSSGQQLNLVPSVNPAASSSPASSQERRITIMLIAVVILFLFCQIPTAAMLLYTSVRELEPNTNEHALVLAFGNIFNFLMAVNAAGNFILYSLLSKKYRKTFVILFCYCLKPVASKRRNNSRFASIRDNNNNNNNSHSLYHNRTSSEKSSSQRDTPV